MKPEPHANEHAARAAARDDRIRSRPASLRAYLKWASREYAMEPPPKLHEGKLMDDHGDPRMTGEAKGYLGFAQSGDQDWMAVARRLDDDGFYLTPMRAALAVFAERHPEVGKFLRGTLTNVLFPTDVAKANGMTHEVGMFVLRSALPELWDLWQPRPLPRTSWIDKSDSQRAAESAA
jgi:hypothetical protein